MPAPAAKSPAPPGAFTPTEPKGAKPLEHDAELLFARFSPCGKYLFAGSYDSNLYRWDLASKEKTPLSSHQGWIQGLAFHPDGQRMFTADSWGGLAAWNYADPAPTPLWSKSDLHPRWMRALALSPDGQLLATCAADRTVRVWSATDGAPRWQSPVLENDLHSLAFHPAGQSLVVGELKGNVLDLDAASGKPGRTLDASPLYLRPLVQGVREINDVGGVRALAFDPAGELLACAGAQPVTSGFFTGKPTIVLLDWKTGERRQTLQWENADPSEGITLDLAWHPDGFLLAASSGQPGKGALYAWKPGDKSPLLLDKKLAHCRSISLHPDARRLAVTQVLIKPGQGAGNGRRLGKDGEYIGLISRVRLFNC